MYQNKNFPMLNLKTLSATIHVSVRHLSRRGVPCRTFSYDSGCFYLERVIHLYTTQNEIECDF